jgi:hypothetical protein
MVRQHKDLGAFQNMIILLTLSCIAFSAHGCEPSYENQQAKKEEERKESIRKEEAKIKKIHDQILEKHNANDFPPQDLGPSVFTYELQKFFGKYAGRIFLFKGYLEDVEKTEHGIVVEFLCPLGENYFMHKTAIRFRLTASESQIAQLLQVKREDPMLRSIRYISDPDYFVVAKISDIGKTRRYDFVGTARGDDVEINVEVTHSFVSTGILIKAVNMHAD